MNNNIKISKFLSMCIEDANHDDLALLWKDITPSKIYCSNVEGSQFFFKFNDNALIYELIGIIQFTEILRTELKDYLRQVQAVNTDERLKKIIKNVGSSDFSSCIAKIASNKIYDPLFFSKLDTRKDVVNFNNGYVNLRTGEFKKRDPTDFFTRCLPYDYNPTHKEADVKKIKTLIKNICNDDPVYYEFYLGWLGYCLTGETTEQKSLWIIGHSASNGKSTMSKIFERCFPCYCFKFDSNSLCEKYDKAHKYIASTKGVRYVYIEELGKSKLNESLYKDLVDGDKINNEVLFKTTEELQILFKLNIISNHNPKFSTDAGMKRRGLMMTLTNKFVEKDDYNPSEKGTYVKDKRLLDMFQTDECKLAFFSLLLEYSKKFYAKELSIPKSVKDQFSDLCHENDKMTDFIDCKVEITNNDKDRIYKDEFLMLYNLHYKVNCNWATILSDVKRCGLKYDREKHIMYLGMSQRGVISGIRWRNTSKSDFDRLVEPVEEVDDYKQKYTDLLAKFEELQTKIESMNCSQSIVEEIPVVVVVNKPDEEMSILTESSIQESIIEDNTAIYRETYKDQYEKLEQITKNIRIINKKLAKIEETDDHEQLKEQDDLIRRLNKNKEKYKGVMYTFSLQVRQVVETCFPI